MFSLILKYSISAALSLLISAIYNIVDRIFVGNFNGTSALAGLSICFPLTYMMMEFGITCSAGGSSLFSLFSGKKEHENMNITFSNSIMLVTTFFQSIVKSIPSIVLTFLRQIVLLITFIYVLPMFWDINGIFIAQPISDIFALIIGIVLIRKEHKYCMEKNKFN